VGSSDRVLVTGAGGFIGHHLVSFLRAQGYWVRGVDLKPPEFRTSDANEFELLDLRRWEDCLRATAEIDEVYALAADMGGMGFISCNHAQILHNNSLINLHCIEAARQNRVNRYLYTSSACVYPEYRQTETDCVPLKRMYIRLRLRMHTDGKSSSANAFAFIIGRILGLRVGLSDFITSSAHSELGRVDERKRRPRCVAKLQPHSSKASMKLKFGAMASKRDPSATSMIALWGYTSS